MVSVEATGNTTVCVVVPTNDCMYVLAFVSVVVPAADVVDVNHVTKLTHLCIPSHVTLEVVVPAPFNISNTLSVSAALPLLTLTAPLVASVSISGDVLLSYACCSVETDVPEAAPTTSPNLEVVRNLACVAEDRSVAVLLATIIPMREK